MTRGAALALALVACGGAPRPAPTAAPAGARLAPGDHVAMLDGAPLAYHVAGHGPVCLALPAGPGSDAAYLASPSTLAHLTLVTIDPVGTGASARLPDPAGYTRARYAADLEKLRAHLGLEKPCLLGHSYGGMVALTHVLEHPDRVGRLILYSTAARADEEWSRAARSALAGRRDAPWFPAAARAFADEAQVKTDDDATRVLHDIAPAYVHAWRPELGAALSRIRGYAAPMTALDRARFDARPGLAAIAVPTLILAGRHDFVCGPRFAEELAAGIPGSRLVIFEDSGHFAHLEEPDAFAAAIAAFVE